MPCHPFRETMVDTGDAVDGIREKAEQRDIPKSDPMTSFAQ